MSAQVAFLAVAAAVCLALSTALWAFALRRNFDRKLRETRAEVEEALARTEAAQSGAEAFDSALLALETGGARLTSGEDAARACATALGLPTADAAGLVSALTRSDPDHGERLKALTERGEPCAFEVRGPAGTVVVEGRASGALAWLRLTAAAASDLPSAARFAAFLDSAPFPAWIRQPNGRLVWANRLWLEAAGSPSLEAAIRGNASTDRSLETVLAESARAGERRQASRIAPLGGRRRAFAVTAQPLEGGGVAAVALDISEAEEAKEAVRRHAHAHDETLNRLADAVAIFGPDRRLSFHNTAFATLWGLEPAWLADRPSAGEILDRLRQRRRLPETADYAAWKAHELAFHESAEAPPDELWSLPEGRTLRVVRQPHPLGGLLTLFSDITDELKLKAQYNALIGVQQATLDKLKDAVAVFGSDGRLRLHNEAFEQLWNVTAEQLEAAGDFDGVVDLCIPLVHDRGLWRDLKARVGDPDPQARTPVSGEVKTSDRRVLGYQSRPLPDGATLVAFADVTAIKDVERALADRSAALQEAERLKRDFVGNVSYELRTPLTTIIGYSELLDRQGEALPLRARGHVAAVRAAAGQLAGSIDDVLDMAQIDAGEMALQLGDVAVSDLLARAADRAHALAEQHKVSVVIECESDGGIRADERRLGQMLDHLIVNAVRATPPSGTVTIACRRALGEVQVSVSDTGKGIPFASQAHIFDRFVGRDRGGPGLGLALVKALAELHGGWVALESEPGAGATFTCHLPEKAVTHEAPAPAELEPA